MNMPSNIDDILLNAFIDGDLDADDEATILSRIRNEPAVKQRVDELSEAKRWTRLAFTEDLPEQEFEDIKLRRFSARAIAAAVGLLAIGGTLGWSMHNQAGFEPARVAVLAESSRKPDHFLFHLDSGRKDDLDTVLTMIEQIMESSVNQSAHIELVANAGGLNLLRSDVSPQMDRVMRLMDKYENLQFVACSNAIKRLHERGVNVQLIPGTINGKTAVEQVIDRLEDGWTYVKI